MEKEKETETEKKKKKQGEKEVFQFYIYKLPIDRPAAVTGIYTIIIIVLARQYDSLHRTQRRGNVLKLDDPVRLGNVRKLDAGRDAAWCIVPKRVLL